MAMIAVEAEVTALCRTLKLLAVGRDAARLADEACRQGTAHLNYLAQLLEIEHRERDARRTARRLKEAGFPLVKTLEGFDFKRAPHLPEVRIRVPLRRPLHRPSRICHLAGGAGDWQDASGHSLRGGSCPAGPVGTIYHRRPVGDGTDRGP